MVVLASAWPSSSWIVRTLVPVLEQVRGERVAEGVTAGRLVDLRVAHCCMDSFLDARFVEVMTSPDAAPRIGTQARSGKDVLPSPLFSREWILSRQRVGKPHLAVFAGEISIVQPPDRREVIPQRLDQNRREHRPPILRSLAVANREDAGRKIEIFHTQTKGLEQAKAGTIEKCDDEFLRPLQPPQDFAYLFAVHDHGQLRGFRARTTSSSQGRGSPRT